MTQNSQTIRSLLDSVDDGRWWNRMNAALPPAVAASLAAEDADNREEAIARVEQELAEYEVLCTGCGKHLAKTDAHYGDHADTYSGTTWHCDKCWAVCEAEGTRE